MKPTLKQKNIDIRIITKAVNSLKKSLPAEVGFAEISTEIESERSHMELSKELNSTIFSPIDCQLDATKDIPISSLHDEKTENKDEANFDPTVQVQIVSAEIHSSPNQSAEPCTPKISTSNRNIASSDIDYDEITGYPGSSTTLGINKNDSFPNLSLSTLHLSGSYLDVGSIMSLDDVLIISLEDDISTPNTSSVEKETPRNKHQNRL